MRVSTALARVLGLTGSCERCGRRETVEPRFTENKLQPVVELCDECNHPEGDQDVRGLRN